MHYNTLFDRTLCIDELNIFDKYVFREDKFTKEESTPCLLDALVESPVFTPTLKDSIFWIVYVQIYGMDNYDKITKYMNTIMEEKQKIANLFLKEPCKIKDVNMKVTKNKMKEIISMFMINENVELYMLHAMAIYYKRKIYIYNDVTYYVITPYIHEDEPIKIYKNKSVYMYKNESLENIHKLFQLDGFERPLKALTNYKVQELREISTKLNIQVEKNDKQSHYIAITKKCML